MSAFAKWFSYSKEQLSLALCAGMFKPINTLIRGAPWEDVC